MSNKELKRCHYIYNKKERYKQGHYAEPLSESEQKFLNEHFNEYWNSDWRISEISGETMNRNILRKM